jgi:hypothetical protein
MGTNTEYVAHDVSEQLYQLTMPYGGVRLDHALKERRTKVTLKAFIKMIEPLMKGLLTLEQYKTCHNDIKAANILMTPQGKAIIIDHTLMMPYIKIYSAANYRRLKMDYFPYPPEFRIVYDVLHKDTKHSYIHVLESIASFGETRRELYFDIVSAKVVEKAVTDVVKIVEQGLKRVAPGDDKRIVQFMDTYINRIDVYGIGALLSSVMPYIDDSKSTDVEKKKFMELTFNMMHPDMTLRATPQKAWDMYASLTTR